MDRWITAQGDSGLLGNVLSRIAPPLRMFHAHTFALTAAIVMSVGVQGLLAVSVYLIASGLYDSPPTLLEHIVIVPIGMLASALPITPAGIGVFEVAIESLYRVVPRIETDASGTLVALTFEIVKVVMAVIGMVFYWTANAEVRESLEAAELEAAEEEDPTTPDLNRSSPILD